MQAEFPQYRQCEWCSNTFQIDKPDQLKKRFCNTSCSAKWRMSNPEYVATLHTPEVAAKRGQKRRAWLASDNPKAQLEIERIRNLNPMSNPATRQKVSERLQEIHHKIAVRGGNGAGMTEPQFKLLEALGDGWVSEYALSLGKRQAGYPTCYKLDIANLDLKINIEVDGHSHRSRKEKDFKRDMKLNSLGWKVLRFWNWDVLAWLDNGMLEDHSVALALAECGVKVSNEKP